MFVSAVCQEHWARAVLVRQCFCWCCVDVAQVMDLADFGLGMQGRVVPQGQEPCVFAPASGFIAVCCLCNWFEGRVGHASHTITLLTHGL